MNKVARSPSEQISSSSCGSSSDFSASEEQFYEPSPETDLCLSNGTEFGRRKAVGAFSRQPSHRETTSIGRRPLLARRAPDLERDEWSRLATK